MRFPPQSSSPDPGAARHLAGCSQSLYDPRLPDDPPTRWDSDQAYTVTANIDAKSSRRTYRITGDALRLSADNLPSLARDANAPNTKVRAVIFDARSITVDMPMYFDSAAVSLLAESIVFTHRGAVGFTSMPQPGGDGLKITTSRLDLSQARSVPFEFETDNWSYLKEPNEKPWPDDRKRQIEISAETLALPESVVGDEALFTYFRSLTLDRFHGRDGDNSRKPYTLACEVAGATVAWRESLRTLVWPSELAAKAVRFLRRRPMTRARICSYNPS
jgi:hypothetical protein